MSDELKPCPFCGKEAATYEVSFPYHYWDVWCDGGCFAHFCERSTEAEAIADWNTRANDSLQPESVISDPDGGSNIAYMAQDSREQIEAYVRLIALTYNKTDRMRQMFFDAISKLLDRQAMITAAEATQTYEAGCEACRASLMIERDALREECDRLREKMRWTDSMNDLLRDEIAEKQKVCDIQRESFRKIERQWADMRKALDAACEELGDRLGTCPWDDKNVRPRDCKNDCDDQLGECWRLYFMGERFKKVMEDVPDTADSIHTIWQADTGSVCVREEGEVSS